MEYKVFISHSTQNQGLVITLANLLTRLGVDVSVAEWYLSSEEQVDKKVFSQIKGVDCMVVLLMRNGIRSKWVHQEVGYAINAGKILIPLVEKGVESKELAALQGKEYIEYDPSQPHQALIKTSTFVKSLKLKKEQQEKTLLIVGVIIALLLLLFGERK